MSIWKQVKQIGRLIGEARRERLAGLTVPRRRGFGSEPKGGYKREAWIADATQLDALIERTGYAAQAAAIHARALPCLHVFATAQAEDAPLGVSRFGGLPDLPPGAAWPRDPRGAPLSFYAQIDLTDLAGTPVADSLPASGLLSFFAGDFQDPPPFPVAVILTPQGAALERQQPPPDAEEHEHWQLTLPVAVRFEPGLSFPDFDWDWLGMLEEANAEGFDTFQQEIWAPFPVLGQILGHASWSQEDLRDVVHFESVGRAGKQSLRIWRSPEAWEEAKKMQSKLTGGAIYRPWSAADDETMRWILDHRPEIVASVARWQSLLTIESNHAMDLWINDANALYFFAHGDALASGDFSTAAAVTAQS